MTELWEIYVPTVRNDGRPYRTRFHRVWDDQVRAVSGGLTILKPVFGQWVDEGDETVYKERMIPVRIACTREQIETIIDLTLKHYDDQIAIFCFRVSDEVIIRRRDE